MQKICIIQTSVSSVSEARMLASDLVAEKMAACVQISGPGLSVYRWKGKVEQSDEYYLSIKTSPARKAEVVNWLQQHHPYELAEIIQTACDATDEYADWLHDGLDTGTA